MSCEVDSPSVSDLMNAGYNFKNYFCREVCSRLIAHRLLSSSYFGLWHFNSRMKQLVPTTIL